MVPQPISADLALPSCTIEVGRLKLFHFSRTLEPKLRHGMIILLGLSLTLKLLHDKPTEASHLGVCFSPLYFFLDVNCQKLVESDGSWHLPVSEDGSFVHCFYSFSARFFFLNLIPRTSGGAGLN